MKTNMQLIEVKKRSRQLKAAQVLYKKSLKDAILHIFRNIEGKSIATSGLTKEEITRSVLRKTYVTPKEQGTIYRIMQKLKLSHNLYLIHLDGKYGWATKKEELEEYIQNEMNKKQGGVGVLKKHIENNSKRLGLDSKNMIAKLELEYKGRD